MILMKYRLPKQKICYIVNCEMRFVIIRMFTIKFLSSNSKRLFTHQSLALKQRNHGFVDATFRHQLNLSNF